MVEDVCYASDRISYLDRFSREVLQREQKRRELLATHVYRRVEAVIIFCIVGVNALFFVFFPQYVIFWIICSLFVIGFSPLVQFFQALVKTIAKKRVPDEEKYVKTLQAFKMLRKSEQFYHIEWSVFFINMRSAAIALGLLCSSNIFAAVGYLLIVRQDAGIGFFIAIQFFLFFLLFTSVILLKPYNRTFEVWIAKIAAVLKRQNLAIRIILLLLGIAGFFTALFFLAAFLSPPATTLGILEREKINLLHFIPEFLVILFSQFTLVRYIHSLESRRMTLKVSNAITRSLQNDVISVLQKVQSGIINEKEMDCVHLRTMMTSLLEARMFTTVVSDIFGLFPLYLFRPDLTLITDTETLKILRGHMSIMA
jgi:hypothetical protein